MIARVLAFAALALALVAPLAAHAQLFRAYLSSTGNDANACTLPAPCRLLPAALDAVADGGEVWMLDSANYNTTTVVVAKSVTLLAIPGAVGSLVGTSHSVLRMDTPGTKVVLRNLVLRPLAGASNDLAGVRASAGTRLVIEKSLFNGFPNYGLVVVGAGATVRITATTIRDNAGGLFLADHASATIVESRLMDNGGYGLFVFGATGGATTAHVSRSLLSGNVMGVFASDLTAATDAAAVAVDDCTITRNSQGGLGTLTNFGGSVLLTASRNVISNNAGPGIGATSAGARAVAGDNTITGNFWGLRGLTGGVVETYGDNSVHQNNTNLDGTVNPISKG